MTDSKTPSDAKGSINWRDILLRAVIPGLLLAIAGFVSEWVITSSSSKAENARLVTDLQIQREQAESDLRKDIFSKAVEALIGDNASQSKIEDHSKRLLKLELLALNFGDSIFLSPLFGELEKDLQLHMRAEPADSPAALRLIDRLRSLAKRVSREQLSFLAQRGKSVEIRIPVSGDGKRLCGGKAEYKWPNDDFERPLEAANAIKLCRNQDQDNLVFQGELIPSCKDVDNTYVSTDEYKSMLKDTAGIALNKPGAEERYVTAVFSDPNPNASSIRVNIMVCKFANISGCDPSDAKTVTRTFTLDYFNFPTIDNTRLPNNDRFAVVLNHFPETISQQCSASIETEVALCPYEYASLRDRPTMRESLEMLKRAQEN